MDSPSPEAPEIEGFAVQSLLGKGGCGAVYLATQLSLKRPVALKVLLSDQFASIADRRRFQREAKLLASLNHPHVMRVYGYGAGERTQVPYIALELLEGGTLKSRFERGGDSATRKLSIPDVLRLTGELLDALATLHDRGIVHRDIKPANILFRPNGAAVLSDLGIAKIEAPDATQITATGVMVGTIAYMPPEAFEKQAPGMRGDLWSLGVVLFEALTGFRPSHFRPYLPSGETPDCTRAAPGTPPELAALVASLLAIDPAQRPENGRQALERIAPLLGESLRFAPTFLPPPSADTSDDESTIVGAGEPAARTLVDGSGPRPRSGRTAVASATQSATLRPLPKQNAAVALFVATGVLLLLASAVVRPPDAVPPARPRLTVHGIEGRDVALAAWLSAAAPVEITGPEGAAGPTAAVTISATPVRVPLDVTGGVFVRAGGERARLTLALPATRRTTAPRFVDLGVATALSPELPRLGSGGAAPLVTDWIGTAGLGWLAVLPDEAGATRLDPGLFSDVVRRTPGLRTLAILRPKAAPGEGPFPRLESALDEIARGSTRPILTFQDFAFDASEGGAWDGISSLIARWRSYIAGRHPQLELTAPPIWALLDVHVPSPEANPGSRVETVIVSLLKASRPHFDDTLRQLRAAFGNRFSVSHVRWVLATTWLTCIETTMAPQLDEVSPLSTARAYLLARRNFPSAAVIFDLPAFIHWRTRDPARSWRVLEQVAARVSGLALQGTVPLPPSALDVTFADGDRRVHAFLADTGGTKVHAVYRPARPGVYTRIEPNGRLTSTLVDPPAPVTLPIDSSLTFYEELAPAAAGAEPAGVVDVGP